MAIRADGRTHDLPVRRREPVAERFEDLVGGDLETVPVLTADLVLAEGGGRGECGARADYRDRGASDNEELELVLAEEPESDSLSACALTHLHGVFPSQSVLS